MNTASRTITCAHLIGSAAEWSTKARRIMIAGEDIRSVGAADGGNIDPLLVLPVLVNAHDHGRAIRTSSIGAAGKPLESWLHHGALFPSVDPYLAAAVALGNSALGGAGVVMMHYTRVQGFTDLPTEATEVARAARDVGVRVGFAVSMRDRNPLVYGASEPVLSALPPDSRAEIERRFLRQPLSPKDQIALVDAVADAAAGPMFDVQYGPNGVQWCSEALLEAIAEASHRTGRRVHMHLLETRYQRAWLDAAYPDGGVRYLDSIGLLSPRLTLAHCAWARPDELELLAERGVTISVNTSSNLHLRSGIAPAAAMVASGCRVALGIDGRALDDDDDSLRELRLAHLLHVGTGFRTVVSEKQILQVAFGNGRLSVTNSLRGGAVEPGAPADLLLLDWAALDDDGLRDNLDPVDLLFSRATARHIREVIVGGRSIVRDRRVLGIDLDAARRDVLAQMRAGMAANDALAAALPALDRVIAQCYEPDHPCC
ncbi:amidohydrolase family protein [Bradyrhizobium prioriisuperbiae]|uniref:amidohydrolase family protein n=1 Tax=Bradyrhizobium prioriisuperbiae TaxID=2854389 RepID=UPI0028E4DE8B|nr:amidohydrolase family protein [Bradyrhizobium prioritasuperba]